MEFTSHLHTPTPLDPQRRLHSFGSSENVPLLLLLSFLVFHFLSLFTHSQSLAQIFCSLRGGEVFSER